MKSTWSDNTLITEHSEIVSVPASKIVDSHRLPVYGKFMGIEYDWFQTRGNHVACSFTERVGPLKVTMKFEKIIERFPGKTMIHFRTNDSIAKIEGAWFVIPVRQDCTKLSVRHELKVPNFLTWLPIRKTVEKKIHAIFHSMKKL